MIPSGLFKVVITEETARQPSLTYRVDPVTKRIYGTVDELNAVQQAAEIIMSTERFAYVIYDSEFGIELEPLFGQDKQYVSAVLRGRVEEALTADDRITGIEDFIVTDAGTDKMEMSYTIISEYGRINAEWRARQ